MDDFVFTNVRRDLLKSVIVSVIAAAAGVESFQLSPDARVFFALVPVYYIGNKLSWLEISMPEARKGVSSWYWSLDIAPPPAIRPKPIGVANTRN